MWCVPAGYYSKLVEGTGLLMRYILAAVVMAGGQLLILNEANASSLVLGAQQLTVDSDGDGLPDLLDNAPGTPNVAQFDTDNDGIGDAIDPTPVNSNPSLGDPGLLLAPALPIPAGGSASFDYLVVLATPPGGWGRIELDFDLDTVTDAVYFGPLTAAINTITIPAGLFVGATWDLYTPGTYTVGMKAYGPGMSSQNWANPNVTVTPVPEPTTLVLAVFGCIFAVVALRRKTAR